MTPALLVLIAVIAVGLTIVSARQASADRDVDRNHRTLDVIGAVATRPPPPANVPRRTGVSGRGPAHARSRSRSRAQWHGGAVLVAVAAVGIAGLAATRYLTRPAHSGPAATVAAPKIAATTTTTVVVPARSAAPDQGPAVMLVSHDRQEADYQIEQPAADVELIPTAACWVEMTAAVGHGPVLFAGTLRPGTLQPVPAAPGGVRVQLGNPGAMSLVADGVTVPMPRQGTAIPFTLLFQSSAPPSGAG